MVAAVAARFEAPESEITDLLSVLVSITELLAAKLDRRGEHQELVRTGRLAAQRATRIIGDLFRQRAALRGRRILVVEDEPMLLATLVRGLLAEGFEVVGAENGRRAAAMLSHFKPDLLITDLVMPEMDGIALIREAKRLRPDLRILAMTDGGRYGRAASYLEWATELGADEVLTKPFRMSSLLTATRLLLNASAPESPAVARAVGEA
jgi:CheY-like chemotaxis protein